MFLTVNTELLTMLMTSLARDADALGSIKVEVEVNTTSECFKKKRKVCIFRSFSFYE